MVTNSFAPHTRMTAFCLACGALGFVYGVAGRHESALANLLIMLGPVVAVAAWLAADAKHTRLSGVMDAGLFFYATWPVSILWYAFATRGRVGWKLVLRLYVLALSGPIGEVTGVLARVLAHHALPN